MIASINGISNTTMQDNTIQKEKAKMSKEQEKALIDSYMQNLIIDNVEMYIKEDRSSENWITETIEKIDSMLSEKYSYTIDERRALLSKYPENLEEFEINVLQSHMDWLLTNSVDGKPTISGKMVGIGTKEEEDELDAFMETMSSLYPNNNKESLSLLDRTDLSIDEFKTLFAKAREKATKDVEEQRKQIIKEEQEYNANFAKEQSEKKFKPMQVKKKYETYDINKDQKFLFTRELLNFKEKRGIDVLELMQKIDKKQILNKMA
ncbi:cell surface protein [Campylobacter concisus]|uniref:Cell surface protein n=1 Tax=Campylobacter concisus TaxID=199 RepID=A0A1Y5ML08_9BACT|nr:cell surface protein [Campylobacter concisus]OUT09260.1 cell surface protein [Campylobacter concisus]